MLPSYKLLQAALTLSSRPEKPRCRLLQASGAVDRPGRRPRRSVEPERDVSQRPEDGEHAREDRVLEHRPEGPAVDRGRAVVAEEEVLLVRHGHGRERPRSDVVELDVVDEDGAVASFDHLTRTGRNSQHENAVV